MTTIPVDILDYKVSLTWEQRETITVGFLMECCKLSIELHFWKDEKKVFLPILRAIAHYSDFEKYEQELKLYAKEVKNAS